MSGNELEFKQRKLSLIQRFFIMCSGADKGIIEECPTEWNKYAGIGAAIFFTGVFACLSGGYALYTVFRVDQFDESGKIINIIDTNALWFAIPFGLLWGAVIFNLDRFIVSTFHKSNETNSLKKFGKEFVQAFPRIILAAIIAITISKPIEIKIFENRLAEQIKNNKNAAFTKNKNDNDSIYEISEQEERVGNLEATLVELNGRLTTDPQNVIDLITDRTAANETLTLIRKENGYKINENKNKKEEIRKNPNSYIHTVDSLGNRVNTGRYTQAAINSRSELQKDIDKWETEIENQINTVNQINEKIQKDRDEHRKQTRLEITKRTAQRDSTETQLNNSKNSAKVKTEEEDQITQRAYSNNFITQLEALGDLTKITDKDDEETRNKKRTMWQVSIVITLLFFVIELAPILTKLLTKRGAYDEILDRTESEKKIEQEDIISRKKIEIEELLRRADEAAKLRGNVMIQMQQDKLDTELQNNKAILDKIVNVQQNLAFAAIDKWGAEQKAMINSNSTTS